MSMILHGYWRSSAAYRVRIALNLKGLGYVQVTHDLRKGEQSDPAFTAVAPQGLVPALIVEDEVLTQSGSIIEWLDEHNPSPPLLPVNPAERAIVRAMAALVGCDIHPLNNLRVQNELRDMFGAGSEQIAAWAAHWITEGFGALDTLIARHGNGYSFGSTPTMADCFLIPQMYSARRFNVDLSKYPCLVRVAETAERLPAFASAHPAQQPDVDPQ